MSKERDALTVIATRHTATLLARCGGASVLLQAGVGNTALAVRDRAVGVLARSNGGSRGESGEAEDDGGDGELHFC